jgi:hypothetical protein
MTTLAFQTPPRILIPKLLRSRDAWEVEAAQRKAERKAPRIRVRDLTASRARHRSRADELRLRLDELRLRHDHVRRRRDGLQARSDAAPQK